MKKHIYIVLVLLLTVVGCRKEPLEGIQPDGQLRIGVEMLDKYYAETIETRSGTYPANDREKKLFDGKGFVFVFKASDGLFQQIAPLESEVVEGVTKYFAILEASAVAVEVKGVANVDIPSAIQTKIDDKSLKIADLANIYTAYTLDNNILKDTDAGLLPKSSGTLSLSEISKDELTSKNITFDFDYSRVDVALPTTGVYPKLNEIYAMNAPALPLSTTKITKTHAVAPTAADAKSVEGLYLYPNATSNLWSKDGAISLMLKVETSEGVVRFYKILMQHPPTLGTGNVYDLLRDYRYLVNITSLTSDGYPTEAEAIAAPHSNIDYNITYDDNSTHIVDNGQYYIGASKGEYWANVESYQSNMLYATQSEFTIVTNNDPTWKYNSDGTYSVEVAFTLGDGDGGNILTTLSGNVTLPAGASLNTQLRENWKTTTTEQKYTINLDADFIEGDVTIELGELTQTIKLTVNRGIITDYTDKTIVEQLTGLPDGYGDVNGLRVANSYIIVPNSDIETIYYIPIVDRINEFWGNDGYANNAANTIIEGVLGEYSVESLWYDQTNNPQENGVKIEKALSPVGKSAIKVTLPKGYNEMGNMLVAVKKGSTVVWSWHLWITDYNPYKTADFENPQRTDINEVVPTIGGEIHSYAGEIWESGTYKNKLIMDRNIGAIDNDFAGHGGTGQLLGSLFYQFGRKDPFPAKTGKLASNNATLNPASDIKSIAGESDATMNPLAFATNNGFSDYDGNLNCLWNDIKATIDNTNNMTGRQKSIFDPSPLGWRTPIFGTFSAFNQTTFTVVSDGGRQYSDGANPVAYYPTPGFRNRTNAVLFNASYGDYWHSNPKSSTLITCLQFFNTTLRYSDFDRNYGFPVRSIQE